jgi:membrane-associated phospholipid phosphatase
MPRVARCAALAALGAIGWSSHSLAAPAEERTIQPEDVEPGDVVGQEAGRPLTSQSDVTPVIPSPTERPDRSFQLYWEIDIPVLTFAVVLGGARFARTSTTQPPAWCVQISPEKVCDKKDLNFVDRPFAGRYAPAWSTASDFGMAALGVAPVLVLTPDQGFLNMLNDSVVIYQSALLATMLSGVASLGASRGRPYTYGDKAPVEVREGPEGSLSYFSGHAAFSFAMSTSLFWSVHRRHRNSLFSWSVLGVGTATASFVALARVMGGKHFPTDALAGAAIGASVGTLIPALHGSPVMVETTPAGDGAMLTYSQTL